MASTWNRSIARGAGRVIGREMRAFTNLNMSDGHAEGGSGAARCELVLVLVLLVLVLVVVVMLVVLVMLAPAAPDCAYAAADSLASFLSALTSWSPTINIVRDPRWGRNQVITSESIYLRGICKVIQY